MAGSASRNDAPDAVEWTLYGGALGCCLGGLALAWVLPVMDALAPVYATGCVLLGVMLSRAPVRRPWYLAAAVVACAATTGTHMAFAVWLIGQDPAPW